MMKTVFYACVQALRAGMAVQTVKKGTSDGESATRESETRNSKPRTDGRLKPGEPNPGEPNASIE